MCVRVCVRVRVCVYAFICVYVQSDMGKLLSKFR